MYMMLCALGRMDEFGVADWGFETNHMCAQTAGSPFSAYPLLCPWVLESIEAEQTILAENAGHLGKEMLFLQNHMSEVL